MSELGASIPVLLSTLQRTEISSEQKDKLKQHFANGMNSVKEKEKIEACSRDTELDIQVIKNFIGNFKRSSEESTSKTSKRPSIQGPNSYNYFVSKMPKGSQGNTYYMKECARKWAALPAEQKQEYKVAAKQKRDDPTKGLSRDKLIAHHIKAITHSVSALEQLGVEAGGIAVDPKEKDPPCVFGSSQAFSFFKDKSLELEAKVKGGDLVTTPAQSKKGQMKTKVRKLYSDLWAKAGGKSRVPYLEIKEGQTQVTVVGLPENITFKDPSDYSMSSLKQIINSSPGISLKIEKKKLPIKRSVTATVTSEMVDGNTDIQQPQTGVQPGTPSAVPSTAVPSSDPFTAPPFIATAPPSTATAPPSTATAPPSTATAPPSTATAPPATAPPSTATAPPSTAPPSTATAPPATATAPPSTATAPPATATATAPPSTALNPIVTLQVASGGEVAEDIVTQIAEQPGLLEQVMSAEGETLNRLIELKTETLVKEEAGSSGKTGKRRKKAAKPLTKKKKKTGSDSKTYTFERITGMKLVNGKRFFTIKWAGYEEETLEPEHNLQKVDIQNFLSSFSS